MLLLLRLITTASAVGLTTSCTAVITINSANTTAPVIAITSATEFAVATVHTGIIYRQTMIAPKLQSHYTKSQPFLGDLKTIIVSKKSLYLIIPGHSCSLVT